MNDLSGATPLEQPGEENSGFTLLSHDLRSSLAGVLGSLSLIDDDALDNNTAGQVRRARASALMLEEMLNLAFDMGGEKPSLVNSGAPVNVADELAIISDIWTVQADQKNRQFTIDIGGDIPLIKSSDRVSFHRILNNLINNSNKYSENGDVTVSVVSAGTDNLTIEVADTGPGFSPAAMDVLFQFRGRPADSAKTGSGLGMFISKTLINNMGGTISARNRDEGGAVVEMSFPVNQIVVPAARKPISPDLPDLSHLKILLAEDNVTNQIVVTQMLKTMGAQFEVTSDGVEALESFDKDAFDVVLLDIEMPRKSGLEVLREIRSRTDEKANIPLIALTAYVMKEHRDRIENAGADGVIAKPIEGIAPLGNAILGYLNATPVQLSAIENQQANLDVGAIDMDVYNSLVEVIGADTMSELLEKVAIDLRAIQENLVGAEARVDMNESRAASHTLISVAGAIGAINLQKSAEALNAAAKTADTQRRQSLNVLCNKGISEVLAFVAAQ